MEAVRRVGGSRKNGSRRSDLTADCAQFCRTAAGFMERGSRFTTEICGMCAQICDACATECEHEQAEQIWQRCADICRHCANECRRVLAFQPA